MGWRGGVRGEWVSSHSYSQVTGIQTSYTAGGTERNGRCGAWAVGWPLGFSPGLEGGREEVKTSGI